MSEPVDTKELRAIADFYGGIIGSLHKERIHSAADELDALRAENERLVLELSHRTADEFDCAILRARVQELEAQLAEARKAKLAFEIYAEFGGKRANTGSGESYYLQARGTVVENEGWNDSRVYPVGERFDVLTIDNVIKTAFVVRGKGGTFGITFDSRLAAIEAARSTAKRSTAKQEKRCPDCKGSGRMKDDQCPVCEGSGKQEGGE